MNKIYYIIYWYKGEIEGHVHHNRGETILFNDRSEAFSYLEMLKHKNPDYTFELRSVRSEREV